MESGEMWELKDLIKERFKVFMLEQWIYRKVVESCDYTRFCVVKVWSRNRTFRCGLIFPRCLIDKLDFEWANNQKAYQVEWVKLKYPIIFDWL